MSHSFLGENLILFTLPEPPLQPSIGDHRLPVTLIFPVFLISVVDLRFLLPVPLLPHPCRETRDKRLVSGVSQLLFKSIRSSAFKLKF